MIKKLFILAFFTMALCPTGSAQEVYNYLLDSSTRTVNNPTSGFTATRIAQFKRTALIYMKSKAFETMPEVTEQFLNTQAYYLSEFITLFFNEILKDNKLDEKQRKEKIYLFMDASKCNPLFDDPDTETTDAYIIEGNELTPFSINTDWQKAWLAASNYLEQHP